MSGVTNFAVINQLNELDACASGVIWAHKQCIKHNKSLDLDTLIEMCNKPCWIMWLIIRMNWITKKDIIEFIDLIEVKKEIMRLTVAYTKQFINSNKIDNLTIACEMSDFLIKLITHEDIDYKKLCNMIKDFYKSKQLLEEQNAKKIQI